MARTIQRALLLSLLAAVLGLLHNSLSPKGIPLITPPKKVAKVEEFVPLEQAQALWSGGGAIFFDARKLEDYEAGHIPNAQSVPAEEFQQHFVRVAPMLTPETQIVVYCDGVECDLSHRLAEQLKQVGYTNVHMLFNGWTSWRDAGFPTETGPPK